MRIALALLLVLSVALPADAVIYRWVDENGSVNFDDDLERVPVDQRPEMKVFAVKKPPAPSADDSPDAGPRQAAFARRVARDLGLQKSTTQDPVSVLQVVGIYPSVGWHPAGPLTLAIVDEVVATTVAAARAHRLRHTAASAEATVLAAAKGLGLDVPPPAVVPEPPPPPPEPAPIVVAPNIIVEAAATAPVIVQQAYPASYAPGWYPNVTDGILFRPSLRASRPPPTARIPPITNPVGRLRLPVIKPLQVRPFQRPPR